MGLGGLALYYGIKKVSVRVMKDWRSGSGFEHGVARSIWLASKTSTPDTGVDERKNRA